MLLHVQKSCHITESLFLFIHSIGNSRSSTAKSTILRSYRENAFDSRILDSSHCEILCRAREARANVRKNVVVFFLTVIVTGVDDERVYM